LHGVGNVRELNEIFRQLRVEGIDEIGNAFDMDKICNPNVRKASNTICHKANAAGLRMFQKCWDTEYAEQKCRELYALCTKYGVSIDTEIPANVFLALTVLVDALRNAGIEPCVSETEDNRKEKDYWRTETKGMDDFLLYSHLLAYAMS